jgi:hypothetical protein
MRALERNKQDFYYSLYIATDNENLTPEPESTYSEPVKSSANITPAIGEAVVKVFGKISNYSHVMYSTEKLPIDENSRIWFDKIPSADTPHNFEVTEISKLLNGALIALREVNVG